MTEERRQFGVLFRHFFSGFLEGDLISDAADLHGPLSKAAAAIALIGLLYPFGLLFRYGRPFRDYAELDALSWSDKSAFVTISLVVMGLLTVIEWDALQLSQRDCRVFGALPIRSRTILWAKLAALGRFLVILSVPLTLLGALTFPVIMHAGWSSGWSQGARTMLAHVVATLAAAWFAFFALLAIQGLLQGVAGQRVARRLGAAIQLTATLGLVVALLMLPVIASAAAPLKREAVGLGGFAPQMWFLGIYQTMAGRGDPDWWLLAVRGWLALIVAAGVGIGASVVAYRRFLGTTLDVVQGIGGGRSWVVCALDVAGRVSARHPAERAFFAFTALTMLRSPWHRVVLAVFLGGALALSMVTLDLATFASDGVHRVPMQIYHALAMQCVILAIVLTGARLAAATPAELRASWMLRLLESSEPRRWMAGFRKAVFVGLVAPVSAAMAAAMTLQYGWRTAGALGLAALAFAGLAFDTLFLGFGRVPFACPYAGGAGEVKLRGPLMAAGFSILVVPVAQLVTMAWRSDVGTAMLVAIWAVTLAVLRWRGNLAIERGGGLAFEPDEGETQSLGLGP